MKIKTVKLSAVGFLVCTLSVLLLRSGHTSSDSENGLLYTGMSSAEYLLADYKLWEATYVRNGGDRNMVISMGWFKGLSTENTVASGQVKLNLIDGTVSVEAGGLSKEEGWDFWLIDNGPRSSVTPDPDDVMVRIGRLSHEGKVAKLEANLGGEAFVEFDPDLYIVTRANKSPIEERVLVGTTTLFHRLYRSGQRGHFGVLADAELTAPTPDQRAWWTRLVESISPTAQADIGVIPAPVDDGTSPPLTELDTLINQGRTIFFNEQFNGNGRTCGTCHRENNNLTIDPEFIATLAPNDALFVAEFTPALAQDFENPVLMRKFSLILENVDGFNNPGVMRGVPHTLALLQNTLTPAPDGTSQPPNERTGWGGDGAPVGTFTLGDGSTHQAQGTLRDFAIGAVIQHFTKRLNRVNGVDFRLPTNAELDALNAFQRSTGRRADLVLSGPGALSLKGEVPRRGQEIFTNGGSVVGQPNAGAGKCFFCHLNAGASDFFFSGQNANFNTNVEQLPSQPADLVVPPQPNPPDGGFGTGAPPPGVFGIGNGTFNTPVLVESGDTGPFFHNNSIETIEGAVDFYNSTQFNNAPGFGPNIGGIKLEATEVVAVAAFLRVINSLENIRSAIDIETRARRAKFLSDAVDLLRLSVSELEDAVNVLDCGGLHPDAQAKLRQAIQLDTQALGTNSRSARNALIDQALALKIAARANMVN